MSSVVAIAGGSGGLGRVIVDAVKADGRYTTLILARQANAQLEKQTGVRVVAVDYSNIDSVAKVLEDNNVDTVISTISSPADAKPLLDMIAAADASKTTRRLIPNIWSATIFEHRHRVNALAAQKLEQEAVLKKTNLEWTGIYPGIFLDYYAPGIPTHVRPFPIVVDVVHDAASIPGSGEYPVNMTYTGDIGNFTAAALSLPKWDPRYYTTGDKKTWKEVVEIAERVKGTKFNVVHDSLEKLEAGQISDLPGLEEVYKVFGDMGKPIVHQLLANIELWILEANGDYGSATLLNDLFPEIQPLRLETALKKAYGKE